METSILSTSFDNVLNKNDFTKLKRELFKYINENFNNLGFSSVDSINNFKYNELANKIINKSYVIDNGKVKLAYYTFTEQEDYYNLLDFIVLYTYDLAQALFVKKTIDKYFHKSLTEILLIDIINFGKYGLNTEYPFHQLSNNYKSNPYIQNYLAFNVGKYLKNINQDNLDENKIMYLKIAEDIIKLLEMRQGFHYKNAYFLVKDRLFALCQCLKNLDMPDSDIENLLNLLNKDFQLPINDGDIAYLANTKKYMYGKEKLAEKIKYNFVRSMDFNFYKIH